MLEFLRELVWRRLPSEPDAASREVRRRLAWTVEHEVPERRARGSDAADLDALAAAIWNCELVTCDRVRGRCGPPQPPGPAARLQALQRSPPGWVRLRDRLQEHTAQ